MDEVTGADGTLGHGTVPEDPDGTPGGTTSDNPFGDAQVVWHMGTPTASEIYAVDLEVYGKVHFGERLSSEDRAASIRRGGNGLGVVLEDGFLALNTHRARRLRPGSDAVSLYVRAWIGPDGYGGLFFSDFMALAIHPTGLAIAFLGVRTPQGKVFRELPLGPVVRGQWLDLVVRVGGGHLDFACNGQLISSIPLRQELCAPFDDDLVVGAFKCSKPDLYGTAIPRAFPDCTIDAVALCKGKPVCKVVGWSDPAKAPPTLTRAHLSESPPDLVFVQISRDRTQQAYWDCSRWARASTSRCLGNAESTVALLAE